MQHHPHLALFLVAGGLIVLILIGWFVKTQLLDKMKPGDLP